MVEVRVVTVSPSFCRLLCRCERCGSCSGVQKKRDVESRKRPPLVSAPTMRLRASKWSATCRRSR
eukprot:3684471-Prymnesium_polylepis.1